MINKKDFDTIVIIADNVAYSKETIGLYDREPDRARKSNVDSLVDSLKKIFRNVIMYDNPELFLQKSFLHKNDIIFPYWHGEKSRNKQALIASICETANMVYIGGDTYTNIVCCDKILSKDICRLAHIKTPKHIVVNNRITDIDLSLLNYPLLVKPTYEGTSIGITQNNLIFKEDKNSIIKIVNELFDHLNQPIIIEEFIGGKELSVSIIGWKDNIKIWGAVERYSETDDNYFNNKVHSFEDKLQSSIKLRQGKHLISDSEVSKLFRLFSWLDKVEYIRVDGKLLDGIFYCFELSHDTTLNPSGSFFTPFSYQGYDHLSVLELLIDNCLERYNNLHPS
ncbi:MAG: hypothetical protein LUH10_13640 [Tannerellaceae bacterium]|nr:hypothetical protein [Tannerellaceae bacterium]